MDFTYVSLERIEETLAILEREDMTSFYVRCDALPANVQEGDMLRLYTDGHLETDESETKKRKKRLFELQRQLFDE